MDSNDEESLCGARAGTCSLHDPNLCIRNEGSQAQEHSSGADDPTSVLVSQPEAPLHFCASPCPTRPQRFSKAGGSALFATCVEGLCLCEHLPRCSQIMLNRRL